MLESTIKSNSPVISLMTFVGLHGLVKPDRLLCEEGCDLTRPGLPCVHVHPQLLVP